MTYLEAQTHKKALEDAIDVASKAIQHFPRLPNGLIPDEVKFSPEFQKAKLAFDRAFSDLRKFNQWFVRTFKREETLRRRERDEQRKEAVRKFREESTN